MVDRKVGLGLTEKVSTVPLRHLFLSASLSVSVCGFQQLYTHCPGFVF